MKKSKDLVGLPIIAISEGKEIGQVKEAVIDPRNRALAGLLTEELDWPRSTKVVAFPSVRGIGDDAIIIDRQDQMCNLDAAKEMEHLLKEPIQIENIKVLTDDGKRIGNIFDFFIDLETGNIAIIEIRGAEGKTSTLISAERILSMSRQLLVVAEEEKRKAFTHWIGEGAKKRMAAGSNSHISSVKPGEQTAKTISSVKSVKPTKSNAAEKVEETETNPPAKAETEITENSQEKGIRQILEERQDAFLTGKTVQKDIVTDEGEMIIKAGEMVNPEVIQKAKEADKYLVLTFSIKRT